MTVDAIDFLLLKGTHGTSKARAEAILNSKEFAPSASDGVVGSGAYFWAYTDEIFYANLLAKNWWANSKNRFNTYESDTDQSCAVLKAEIRVEPNSYLDATTEIFKCNFLKFIEFKSGDYTDSEVNRLRTVYIQELARCQGLNYCVIKANVRVPGKGKGSSETPVVYSLSRDADCYVVSNDSLSCIKEIESVD